MGWLDVLERVGASVCEGDDVVDGEHAAVRVAEHHVDAEVAEGAAGAVVAGDVFGGEVSVAGGGHSGSFAFVASFESAVVACCAAALG